MANSKQAPAIISAIVVYTLWGFTFMASKVAQGFVTPFLLLAYRFDISVLLLLVIAAIGRKKLSFKGKNIKPLLLLGLMEPCIYFIGEQYGVRLTNSAFSGVMISVIPIITLIMSVIFLKEKPTAAQWLFSILSIAGIIAITLSESSGGDVSFLGFICLVLAVVTGSACGVISRGISDDFSVFERTFFMQLMGAVFFTVLAVGENFSDPLAFIEPLKSSDFILAALYLSVGASIIGYSLFNYALSNAPIAKVISLCNLTTVISVLAGVIILGDRFTIVSAIAMAAVLVGIWGTQKFDKQNIKSGSQ